MKRRVRVGVAVGSSSIAAAWRDGAEDREWHFETKAESNGLPSLESLRIALTELRERARLGVGSRIAIAVLPPLSRIRHIELPRMRDDERRLAVERSAERHFLGLAEPVLCATYTLGRGSRSIVPFLVAGVPSQLIRDLSQVVSELGFAIERTVPAQAAWAQAAIERWPKARRGTATIQVAHADEQTLARLESGRLRSTRRLRPGAAESAVGDNPQFSIGVAEGECAAIVAARAALSRVALEWLSDAEREKRKRRAARVPRVLVGVAAALAIVSAASYRMGLSRDRQVVAAQRVHLHAKLTGAMAARDTLTALSTATKAIATLERSAPRWSAVLSQAAVGLPSDASIASLRAEGDSVMMSGQASNAAGVFAALRGAPGIVGIRSTAPIRQELAAGQQANERWTLTIHVAHDVAAGGRR
jgi:hypothetical protein